MMRRLCVTATLCALVHVMAPPSAAADIWDWFAEASGPGPFTGFAFEWRLVCFSEPDPAFKDAEETTEDPERTAARILQFLGPGCFFKQVPVKNRRTASINVKFGLLEAKRNHLVYERPDANKDVKLTTLMPSVAWRPTRSFEMMFGVGLWWFSGPSFESFHRVILQPVQLDVKPAALINQLRGGRAQWWDELLSLRGGVVIVPRGFDDQDFGALPGTFQVSRDTMKSAAVFLDLESLVMHLRRGRIEGSYKRRGGD